MSNRPALKSARPMPTEKGRLVRAAQNEVDMPPFGTHEAAPTGAGDRFACSALRHSLAASPFAALTVIAAALVMSWVLTYLLGGTAYVVPHWYYLPIALAAVRFGPGMALAVALASGVLAGPLSYAEVAGATPQEASRWLTRTGFFVVIGLGMAALVRPSLPSIREQLRRHRNERTLRRALSGNEFFLRYQPIIDCRTGQLASLEALIRWQHPHRGELSPADFLPLAEESSVIEDVGAFVLLHACREAALWHRLTQATRHPPVTVSVNISGRELASDALVDRVRYSLRRTGLPASLLVLEVTESVLVEDAPTAARVLADLKALGVGLAVDDFGTGHSSLASLQSYPVDVVKLDRAFITANQDLHETEQLLEAMVLFARRMELTTVAEGIESPAQAALVTRLGYDLAQGYLYAPPLAVDEIQPLLTRTTAVPRGPVAAPTSLSLPVS